MNVNLPLSAKPQLVRAAHEWCSNQGFTPYLLVVVDGTVNVPREHVKDGQIVLNTSYDATGGLTLGDDFIEFKARFGGVARDILVPMNRVLGIFSRETGEGAYFEVTTESQEPAHITGRSSIQKVPVAPAVLMPAQDGDAPESDSVPPDPPKGGSPKPFLVRVK